MTVGTLGSTMNGMFQNTLDIDTPLYRLCGRQNRIPSRRQPETRRQRLTNGQSRASPSTLWPVTLRRCV